MIYDPLKIVFSIKDVKYSLHMVIGVHLYILELTIRLGVSEVNDLMSSLYMSLPQQVKDLVWLHTTSSFPTHAPISLFELTSFAILLKKWHYTRRHTYMSNFSNLFLNVCLYADLCLKFYRVVLIYRYIFGLYY